MRKINIMEFRSTHTTGGGPDKTILVSAKQHDKEKFNVIVVYLKSEDDVGFKITEMAKKMELNFIEVNEKGKIDIKSINYINHLIKKHNIDILHAHDYKTNVLGWFLSKMNNKVVLLTTAHGWVDVRVSQMKHKFYNWLDFQVIKRFHKVIAVCASNKNKLIKRRVSEDKITIIYNAIDIDEWKKYESGENIRNELSLNEDTPLIGAIGRIAPEKGLDILIEAAVLVIKEVAEARFLIAGKGDGEEDENRLKSYAKQLGIEKNVMFLGYRSDTKNIYNSIDVFALPSLTEGLANTLLESQAMEIPVVATDVGGNGEVITNGINGFLLQPQDASALAEKIIYLLKNKEIAREMGRQGRKIICERFSFTERLKKIEQLYVSLMKK
ncbi:glycosyltransferase family 4 protein [bacterium]|nr:glycosyltransferase family 4 protein [bacterium]MBU1752794.1 glycosyltransferase family 4 protein [bacterium]